jgi:DnaJ family protein A protein 5
VSPTKPEETLDTDGESTNDSIGDEYAARSEVENRLLPGDKDPVAEIIEGLGDAETDSLASGVDGISIGEKKIGKARAKREKKAARMAANASEPGVVSLSVVCNGLPISPWLTVVPARLRSLQRNLPLSY